MSKDRHENSRWEFRQAKPDPNCAGAFIRLYRSRQNPNLFKRVFKSTCCASAGWETVHYATRQSVAERGEGGWVASNHASAVAELKASA